MQYQWNFWYILNSFIWFNNFILDQFSNIEEKHFSKTSTFQFIVLVLLFNFETSTKNMNSKQNTSKCFNDITWRNFDTFHVLKISYVKPVRGKGAERNANRYRYWDTISQKEKSTERYRKSLDTFNTKSIETDKGCASVWSRGYLGQHGIISRIFFFQLPSGCALTIFFIHNRKSISKTAISQIIVGSFYVSLCQ